MEKTTPFDIPLLNNEICQYLSPNDLARCVLVSKAWANWFTPTLWRDLDCNHTTPDIPTLSRRREHIRIVRNISMKNAGAIREQLPFPNLYRLEFQDHSGNDGVHRANNRFLLALEKASTLQHLQITLSLDLDHIHQQWIRTLQALTCLESLTLSCHQLVSGMVIQQILHLCLRLQRLSLRFSGCEDYLEDEDQLEYDDARTAIEKMPEMQLRELSFRSDIELYEDNILQPLLERCPRLEKLDLAETGFPPALEFLAMLLRENKLLRLRHLTLKAFWGPEAFEQVFAHISCGLVSVVFLGGDEELIVQLLIQYHSHSLTILDIVETIITFGTLSELMTGLPNLQSFAATNHASFDDDDEGTVETFFDKRWVCVRLRSLKLSLEGRTGSDEKNVLGYVFSEVAKLTGVQELSIGCDLKNLYRTTRGYLGRLDNLKQLKVIDLACNSHCRIGEQEALWMAKSWPKLLQIYERDTPAIFKATLLQKRPRRHFLRDTKRGTCMEGRCGVSMCKERGASSTDDLYKDKLGHLPTDNHDGKAGKESDWADHGTDVMRYQSIKLLRPITSSSGPQTEKG
ncbi:MAG: hypothetical protein J3Q66DRAFT_138596 [Benniella sp.]|nr:MAG: hypothetical protein J3Q66DRAFT_138596 [Benniella sp.]